MKFKVYLKSGKVFTSEQNLKDSLNHIFSGVQKFRNVIDEDGVKHAFLYIPTQNIDYAYREK